jgi:hypothetical protein
MLSILIGFALGGLLPAYLLGRWVRSHQPSPLLGQVEHRTATQTVEMLRGPSLLTFSRSRVVHRLTLPGDRLLVAQAMRYGVHLNLRGGLGAAWYVERTSSLDLFGPLEDA